MLNVVLLNVAFYLLLLSVTILNAVMLSVVAIRKIASQEPVS
jgi:hypothetical protein